MSYHRKSHARYGPRARSGGLGDVASTLANLATAVQTGVEVGSDPYLPETICRAQQLIAIENQRPVPACASTPANLSGGIGLRIAMPVLRGLVYAQQHKWVYPVAVAGVIGVPMLVGYLLGKGSKR